MRIFTNKWLLLNFCVILLQPLLKAEAESFTAGGITLPVDLIQYVDSRNVKISIFSATKIVPKEDLESTIIAAYLETEDRFASINVETWQRYVITSIEDRRGLLAAQVADRLIQHHGEESCRELPEWLGGAGALPFAKQLLQSAKAAEYPTSCQLRLLVYVGRKDLGWYRSNATAQGYHLRDQLFEAALEEWGEFLRTGDFGVAQQLGEFLHVIAEDKRGFVEKLKLATDLVRSTRAKGNQLSNSDLLPLLSLRNTDPALSEALNPVVDSLIHLLVERSISRSEPESALATLSHIAPERRTPTTHELASKAVSALPLDSNVLSAKQLKQLINTIAVNDKAFSGLLQSFYEQKARHLASDGKLEQSRLVLSDLVEIRPDPNAANDKLRVEIALTLLGRDDRAGAAVVLESVKTALSLRHRMELILSGLYGPVVLYILLLSIPLLIKIGLSVVRAGRAEAAEETGFEMEEIDVSTLLHNASGRSAEDLRRRAFVSNRAGRQLDPLYEEYLECLKVFGLDVNADVRAIKLAYRSAVKEIHPDLNAKNDNPRASERFIKLTKAYDRIRELQRMFGIQQNTGGGE
ncbi:MAG: J domain-containing protein [Deltaproteobacteria bacterium]|nr:J domain-containing protein [Deltaproteobacteria bacterium]